MEPLTSLLAAHGFRVATLARHPLDTLISILHFAAHEPETHRWLDSEGGDESSIIGASPCSPAFLAYATSDRAGALLSVSRDWWQVPRALRVRYEELVHDPSGELRRLIDAIGQPPVVALEEVAARHTLDWGRERSTNQHYWQGRPGLWRRLLTAEAARRITASHLESFRVLGYHCDPESCSDRQFEPRVGQGQCDRSSDGGPKWLAGGDPPPTRRPARRPV